MSTPKSLHLAKIGCVLLLVTLVGCQQTEDHPLIGVWNGDMPAASESDSIESLSIKRVGFDFQNDGIVTIRRTVVRDGAESEQSETTTWKIVESTPGETIIEITNPGQGQPRTRTLSVVIDADTIRIEEPKVIDDVGPIVLRRVK